MIDIAIVFCSAIGGTAGVKIGLVGEGGERGEEGHAICVYTSHSRSLSGHSPDGGVILSSDHSDILSSDHSDPAQPVLL